MTANTAKDLMNFFSTEENPCKSAEFMKFWTKLTEAEKEYYRSADLG